MAVRFPTSAAYWNLRAEQVMNKVFEADPVEPIDVAIEEPAVYSSAPVMDSRPAASKTPMGLVTVLGIVAVTGVVSSGWLLSHWQNTRDQLAQERNQQQIERLETDRGANAPAPPPPAPEPDWMDEFSSPTPLELQPAPLASLPPAAISVGPLPQLTGVVQGPGGRSSAIFQVGSNSLSAGLGDAIGSSGWVLESVSETGAVIRRDGQRHRLAVGGLL